MMRASRFPTPLDAPLHPRPIYDKMALRTTRRRFQLLCCHLLWPQHPTPSLQTLPSGHTPARLPRPSASFVSTAVATRAPAAVTSKPSFRLHQPIPSKTLMITILSV